jgi:hypothetical protein
VTLSRADLKMSHFCARVTDAVTASDHPIRQWLPAHLDSLTAELTASDLGHQSDSDTAELELDELITAAQAATIIGRSRRQVQRIALSLDGRIVCGRWLFNRQTVLDYAEAMHE